MNRNLFEEADASGGTVEAAAPLADRMRPLNLDEVVGQPVVARQGYLRRAIGEGRVPSMILWGPPGSGKTTIAKIIARELPCHFVPFSAVTSGIKEVKEVMAGASRLSRSSDRPTVLFVDEIHRFNRAQQDAFLPYVERGDITLIGATTENPSFHLNAALMSRCRLVVLEPLSTGDLRTLISRALEDPDRGLGKEKIALTEEAVASVLQLASGDARKALNLLELVAHDRDLDSAEPIGVNDVIRVAQRKVLPYDRSGEEHFNLISALHKSIRESDPDASLYWLSRMLTAGEEPLYIARRLVRIASEDVGLADPAALPQTLAAWDAYSRLGSPEGELALAQAVAYLALSPKSNAVYIALGSARRTVEEAPAEPVPKALRNAPTRLMAEQGYGHGYVYAHDTPSGLGGLDCLPDSLQGTRFYEPRRSGFEAELADRLEAIRELRARVRREPAPSDE